MTIEEAKEWGGRHVNSFRLYGLTPEILKQLSDNGDIKAIESLQMLDEAKDVLGFTTLGDMFSYYENRLREVFSETE